MTCKPVLYQLSQAIRTFKLADDLDCGEVVLVRGGSGAVKNQEIK